MRDFLPGFHAECAEKEISIYCEILLHPVAFSLIPAQGFVFEQFGGGVPRDRRLG